jgi:sugar lactone lactonase YvrE
MAVSGMSTVSQRMTGQHHPSPAPRFGSTLPIFCAIASLLAAPGFTLTAAEPTPLYRWTTFAGRATTGYDDGPAAEARFNNPHGLALDASGNLYVADNANHTIRKISPQGIVSTFAGSPDQPGSTDGTGSAARFQLPKGVAVDPNGNVYVADSGNHTVRKITPAGVVTTLAGLAGQSGSTDGTGSAARFFNPIGIFADASGNVYVLQEGVRRIAPNGTVDTIPLTGSITTPVGTQVSVTVAGAVAVDSLGQIYFTARPRQPDGSLGHPKRIVKRDVTGALTVLASSDPDDGKPYLSDSVSEVIMTTDGAGSLYFVSQLISSIIQNTLYRIAPDGTLASVPWRGAYRGGYGDDPKGLAVSADGRIFHTAPAYDDVIFLNQGESTTLYAGTLWSNQGADGAGASARFSRISGLGFSSTGQLHVSDNYSHYSVHLFGGANLRTVSPTGETSTPYAGPTRERPPEISLGIAPLASNRVALGTYYATTRLTQIGPDGAASALAKGNFQDIRGMASDAEGRLFVADMRALHRRDLEGTWALLAGAPDQPASIVDGDAANARFANIISLDVAPNGDAYVLDHLTTPVVRAAIRRIQPNGTVTTVQENLLHPDGASPAAITLDAKGDFIVTYSDDTVRLRTASGTDFIIGGVPNQYGTRDGAGQAALFYQPNAITTDAQNNVFVADNANVTIRKGEFLGYSALITTQPQSVTVAAGSSAQFSVTASGTPAPTYQWQFNGTAITGATGSTLVLNNVTTANAGNYLVVVTNSNGSVTSNAATLTVTTPPPPPPGSGGGGSPSHWFVAALLALCALRWSQQRKLLR